MIVRELITKLISSNNLEAEVRIDIGTIFTNVPETRPVDKVYEHCGIIWIEPKSNRRNDV